MVVVGSHHVGEGSALEPIVRRVNGIERAASGVEIFEPLAFDDRGQVPSRRPLALDIVLVNETFEFGETGDHQP